MKKAAPVPNKSGQTYQQFTTERPTFANDDLLSGLTQGGATVRATPIVQHRGFLTNLLVSMAPILLIVAALGGMAAEQEMFNIVTGGSEADLEIVARIARSMVGRWGMSERIGRLSVLPVEGDPRMSGVSDGLLDAVDEEVRRITDECYGEARRLLKLHRKKLDAIVAQLLVHESLDEPDIYAAAGIPRSTARTPRTPAA